jgi:hypothetical protein
MSIAQSEALNSGSTFSPNSNTMGTSLVSRNGPLFRAPLPTGKILRHDLKTTAPTYLSLDEARALYRRFAGDPLSTAILHPQRDDAFRAMVTIALMAKEKQAGWGRLRLEALRQLGMFLIRFGKTRGRPAKTSTGDGLPTLAGLGITDRHISADAKSVARVSNKDFDTYLTQEDEPTLKGLLRFTYGQPDRSVATEAMNIDFEATSTEWLTPKEVFDAMAAVFDADVCRPGKRRVPWIPAREHYTPKTDGLKRMWEGFIWMNAPYGLRNGMLDWIKRFIEHANGVALVPDFTSTEWWQQLAKHSECILFVCPKIQFLPKTSGRTNTLGTTLVSIGEKGVLALQTAEANGLGVCFRR